MKILRHRSNSAALVESGLRTFDGLELDVRANDFGIVLVEHHPGENGAALSLVGYLSCVATVAQQLRKEYFLAINVKCNGICESLASLLRYRSDYFLFDVPGEELTEYDAAGLRVFSRWSENDQQRSVTGTIIDCFEGDYTPFELMINDPLLAKQPIAVIGEDLRGRAPLPEAALKKLRCEYLITKEYPTWA